MTKMNWTKFEINNTTSWIIKTQPVLLEEWFQVALIIPFSNALVAILKLALKQAVKYSCSLRKEQVAHDVLAILLLSQSGKKPIKET